jgi:hypothetical protein
MAVGEGWMKYRFSSSSFFVFWGVHKWRAFGLRSQVEVIGLDTRWSFLGYTCAIYYGASAGEGEAGFQGLGQNVEEMGERSGAEVQDWEMGGLGWVGLGWVG